MTAVLRTFRVSHALLAATLMGGLALTLTGCGESADEEAVAALCNEWSPDPNLSDDENSEAFMGIIGRYDYEKYPDELERDAVATCPLRFRHYYENRDEDTAGSSANTPTAPEAEADPDTSIVDVLKGRGVSDHDVRLLGAMADETGYGLDADTSLGCEQAQSFAAVLIMTCDNVADGSLTWAQAIAEDVATGAPLDDARTMNDYLRDVYCPTLS